jgi:hypothetical protein
MEYQPYAEKMQREMMEEIEKNKPEYVIYANDDLSWLIRPNSKRMIFDWWKEYWTENLDLIETVNIDERREITSVDSSVELKPAFNRDGSRKCLLLLKRKKS